MKEIQHPKEKVYYSMGEVCEMFDVNPPLIRYWESKFAILRPHKNKKGNRLFTPQDVDNLRLIYHLVKEKGMTLRGAEMHLRQNKDGSQQNLELVERLQKIRAMLVEIREELRDDPQGFVSIPVRGETDGAEPNIPSVGADRAQVHQPETTAFAADTGAVEQAIAGPQPEPVPAVTAELDSPWDEIPAAAEPEPEPEPEPAPEEIPLRPTEEPAAQMVSQPTEAPPTEENRPRIIEQTLF